ncbi:MAG: hypothetical protein ACLFOA_07465 [Desulfohalobiaceae bacterium]
MTRILLVFPVMSFLILAAHELRVGNDIYLAGWVAVALVCILLRRPWVRHTAILALVLGLLIWIQAAVEILRFRIFMQQPYGLFLAIMSGVGIWMLASIFLLCSKRMQGWFLQKGSGQEQIKEEQ